MKKLVVSLCLLLIPLSLMGCSQINSNSRFNGSSTCNDDQFIMDYSVFNGTKAQSLVLSKEDVLDVEIVSDAGEVSITVQKGNNTPIYKSDNAPTCSFQLVIEQEGTYKITVIGRKAKGGVHFIKKAK